MLACVGGWQGLGRWLGGREGGQLCWKGTAGKKALQSVPRPPPPTHEFGTSALFSRNVRLSGSLSVFCEKSECGVELARHCLLSVAVTMLV